MSVGRRAGAILAWLAAGLVAAGGLSAPAAARPRGPGQRPLAAAPAAAARPTMIVDDGFTPARDGYSFPNYGAKAGVPDLGPDEMVQLFGSGVCAGYSGGACVLSPPALAWMTQENEEMADGHCEGFSVTAQFFFAHLSTPKLFGSSIVPGLKVTGNQLLAREIAYGFVFQDLASVRAAEVFGTPDQVLSALESELHGDTELYTLGITQPDGSGGHAVTPFAVQRLSPDRYGILVYDNNYPGQTRQVIIDTSSDTWSYEAAPNPSATGSLYTGGATTRSLFLLPTRPGLGMQPCPFCAATAPAPAGGSTTTPTTTTPTTSTTTDPTTAARARRPAAYDSIRLQIAGGVGHLLITDPHGRSVGFVDGRLVNRIPGARILSQLVGGPQTWRDHAEPEYQVPAGPAYRIVVRTAGPRRRGRLRWRAAVTVLEPGFIAAVRQIRIGPGRSARLTVPAGGHAIAFVAPGLGRQAPELVVGDAVPGSNDYQWTAVDGSARAGEPVAAALDVAGHRLSLHGAGSYDMTMDLVRNGVSVFTHNAVAVPSGMTVNFDYGGWAAGDAMPVTDTVGDTTTAAAALGDEPSAPDAGDAFDPVETTAAPPEPDPGATSMGETATTLICRPAELVAGDTTTCDVEVDGLDPLDAGTPGGEVDFSSDDDGTFSAPSCELSDGVCEVTYTPSAVGSGEHDLTAGYQGAGEFHASGDTATVAVDPRATDTSLDCEPQAVALNAPDTCTVTVTDIEGAGTPSTPTGEVDFSDDAGGTFSASSCELDGGACAVTYTPTAIGSDEADITAGYDGDGIHDVSDDTAAVDITPRATELGIDCSPDVVAAGASTTCTATVTDTDAGTAVTPTGTVTFSDDIGGSFDGNPCTLVPADDGVASCAVTYTLPADSDDPAADIGASYGGDAWHSGSS